MPRTLLALSSRTVILRVGDRLRDTVINIKEGQTVRAVGKLVSLIGKDEVLIEVANIIEELP